ncbi:MAG: SDR family oxidoreductase [Planctomycetes bacterium]|nr:SDR family oxidoreductase [Planctomycetota bacterium]
MESLQDKVAIVTGASRGIGRAVAVRLAREGARVTAVARSRSLLDELAAAESGIRTAVCDVTVESDVQRVVSEVLEREGCVDALVNNAGIGLFRRLEETSYAEFLEVLHTNAGGTFLFSRAVLPAMKARGRGEIINISSVVGARGYPLQTAYGASKHAVLGFTKALAAETAAEGIRVRSICPGGVDTQLGRQARPEVDTSGLIRPEDIADLVLFVLTASPTAVVDNINVRRPGAAPWF